MNRFTLYVLSKDTLIILVVVILLLFKQTKKITDLIIYNIKLYIVKELNYLFFL